MEHTEKVIKAWEIFRDSNPYEICSGREFRAIKEPEYCMGQMIEDTIKLLKKQKPKTVTVQARMITIEYALCPTCGEVINSESYPHSCGFCGQEVKWE